MDNEQIENCLQELLNLMIEQGNFMKELTIEIGEIRNKLLEHILNSKPKTKENENTKKVALSMLNRITEIQKGLLKSQNNKEEK